MNSTTLVKRAIFVMLVTCLVGPTLAVPQAKPLEFWDDYEQGSRLSPDHSNWQSLLDKHVISDHPSGINRVNYEAFTDEDEQLLRRYLVYLQQLDPRQLNRNHQKAYWLNLYNATMVLIVVVSKPNQSIRSVDRKSLWVSERFNIALQKLSLDDVEHGILRALFKDERIHFVLNRATLGSGNINPIAYTGDNVEELLDKCTREFLSHARAVSFVDDELYLSRLFFWYKEDFSVVDSDIKAYLKKYLRPSLGQKLDNAERISYQYDWALNKL